MDIYKKLFEKGYLNGPNKNSPLTLKAIEKLSEKYMNENNFVNIKFINENEFLKEFNKFFEIYGNFKKEVSFKEFENENNKLYELKEYTSEEEDILFSNLKNFNKEYQNADKFNNKLIYDRILKLKKFSNKCDDIITDLMCKKILDIKKTHDLNFYIWIGNNESHYSTVCNIESYYLFFDSCSTFYNRWPTKTIITSNKNDNLFLTYKTLVMKSFLQNDGYNCGSFAIVFIDIIINLFTEFYFDKATLLSYFLKYFLNLSEEGFLTENFYNKNEELEDLGEASIYPLPLEFLKFCQSSSRLNCLKQLISKNEFKSEIKNKIDHLLLDMNKGNGKDKTTEIEKIRNSHLEYLMLNE